MRVLVTGADGFIGSRLVPVLTDAGHDVVAWGRDVDLALPLAPGAAPAVDAFVHLAQAKVSFHDRALELYRVNTMSTAELLEQARATGARRFVLASSGSIYGLGDGVAREDDPRRATDYYAVTKRNAEQLVEAYAPYLSTVVLRLFAPYGPGQQGRLVPGLAAHVREGRPVTLHQGGRPLMTPIYVDDVLRVLLAAIELDGHHVLNVAGDETVSIRGLAELIGDTLGREPVFEESGLPSGDLVADNTRLHEVLPGDLTPLAEGLRRTVLSEVRA